MKNIVFILVLFALAFSACKESMIMVPDIKAGNRVVLVEELTGVRCQGCPEGSAELVRQDSIYGENLIVVSIHAAIGFSTPYSAAEGSDDDFRLEKADELATYIGEVIAYPTASFNRHIFPPNNSAFLNSTGTWGGFIAQELNKPAPVTMNMTTDYTPADRKLNIDVVLAPEENLLGDLRITVMVTEDKVIDPQKVGADFVKDYVHRHVLREIVTGPIGDKINEQMTAGNVISKNFFTTLPDKWNADNCTIVAFVHRNDGVGSQDVLQATEVHLHE